MTECPNCGFKDVPQFKPKSAQMNVYVLKGNEKLESIFNEEVGEFTCQPEGKAKETWILKSKYVSGLVQAEKDKLEADHKAAQLKATQAEADKQVAEALKKLNEQKALEAQQKADLAAKIKANQAAAPVQVPAAQPIVPTTPAV